MQLLSTHFTEGRFAYTELHREGMLALYSQTHRDGGAIRYEVVKIRIAREHTWPDGTTTPEREAYPGASQWGRLGWTFHYQPDAEAWLAHLQVATRVSGAGCD